MKKFLLALSLLSSLPASATTFLNCHVQINPRLGIGYSESHHARYMIWDDRNLCNNGICTEIAPARYRIKLKNVTPPRTQGAVKFKIKSYHQVNREEVGGPAHPTTLKRFAKQARFMEYVIPDPNMNIIWEGHTYEMDCSSRH